MGQGKESCPSCGSDQMKYTKKRISAAGTMRVQFQCKKCGKYHTVAERTAETIMADGTK